MRFRYRAAQFWRAIYPQKLSDTEKLIIRRFLTNSEWDLFNRYSVNDQRHSYQVFRTLELQGCKDPGLLAAALLHDVGKTKIRLSVWDRSLAVICEAIIPELAAKWGIEDGKRWRRPFVIRAMHPQWGAQMAKSAGSKTMVVNLIRRHQDPLPKNPNCLEDEFLALLQWADDLN